MMEKRRFLIFCLNLCLLWLAAGCGVLPPQAVRVALLGDVMLGRGVARAHEAGATGDCAPWEKALAALGDDLRGADLALANLESPVAEGAATQPLDLRAPVASLAALSAVGVDYLSLANNHRLDAGLDGLAQTRRALGAQGLGWIGPGPVTLWDSPGGLRLALLALDDVSSALDVDQAAAQVQEARRQGRVVIVSIHWGGEYQTAANERQQQIAQRLVNAGAALVWGHHPHVLQPAAWLAAENGGKALVFYSLGNALFDQTPPDTQRSALALVTLDTRGVRAVKVAPFRIDPSSGCVRLADEATGGVYF